ncbi:MAG: pyruvate dehydrogenase (acetyl-transferring) E1 component subunit alpha [Rhodospirillaceae bacterium]|jgi:2-oxoisovalerate dehydrogenase E1 component alpha subunit|nr:pyruvate dehydrogenase (acetyl-transferring) E1 component subunit alpha [Rhodospirillaceae bacterium]MBT5457353.1 pyruvate dehydrogenase (acetyl-transferring) E1 component subunit alpha [Rhodospirillaceae bacterium]
MAPPIKHDNAAIDLQRRGASPADPDGEIVAQFQIRYRRFLDPNGQLLDPSPPLANDSETLKTLYRAMALARAFDKKAIALQRTGELRTYPSCQGQEAIAVGLASAMKDDDVLLPTYREQGAQLWRGISLTELMLYWAGDERGSNYANQPRDFPVSVPIASHTIQAVGVATAMKLRHEPRVAVCTLGDGATSEGDFYEAINLAGVWNLPVVFVVSNNQWAISMPRAAQTAAETIAQKAIAGGFGGEQIDGNDIIAVRVAAEQAIEKARAGGGPSLIEALTYRLGDHTTADDATRYRIEAEVSAQWANDPMARIRTYLANRGWWTKEDEEALVGDCKTRIDAAQEEFLAMEPQPVTDIFDYLFAELPESVARQRESYTGDDHG